MSLCTPEEIAEKRRIALERLNAKKQNSLIPNNLQSSSLSAGIVSNFPSRPTTPGRNSGAAFLKALSGISDAGKANKSPSEARTRAQPYSKLSPFKNNDGGVYIMRGPDGLRQFNLPEKNPRSNQSKEGAFGSKSKEQTNNQLIKSSVFYQIVTCSLSMISEQRFVLRMSEFHNKIIDVCKTIPSKGYDGEKKIWSFDIKDYKLVEERIGDLRPNIVLEGIPKKILETMKSFDDFNENLLNSYMASITDAVVHTLLPFQKEGVAFGIKKQGRLLIGDEMGLGKTYQALALADLYKEDWPLLIATTASTRDSWVTHIRKLMPYVNCHHIACITASHEYFEEAKVVVCSYPMLEKCIEKFESMHFGVLIMDESHNLKNSKAKCTLAADKLARKSKRVILLSGTPALSRPVELFSQINMLDRRFMNFIDYTKRYCDGKQGAFGWDANGQSNLEELKIILSKKFMIRRTKAEVLPQLAEKYRETVYLDADLVKAQSGYKQLAKDLSQTISKNLHIKEDVLIQYYAETGRIKCAAICFYLRSVIKDNIKFIVFAHHKVVLDSICECLDKLKVKHVRIDGTTKNDSRAQKIKQFQAKESCRVAVLSLKACNAGISLTATQLIIFAELDWNPSTLFQAESRAHRIGQEGNVTCRYLLARNTADDIIWRMLHEKQDVLNKAGLFSEDLRHSEHIVAPSSAGDIQKFVIKTPRKNDNNTGNTNCTSMDDNSPIKSFGKNMNAKYQEESTENKVQTVNDSFEDLLNDGDDGDFANIDF